MREEQIIYSSGLVFWICFTGGRPIQPADFFFNSLMLIGMNKRLNAYTVFLWMKSILIYFL